MTAITRIKPIAKPRAVLFATGVGMVTLVGILSKEYPLASGNCFDLRFPGKQRDLRVLNFCAENLDELLKRKVISWPIQVVKATARHCYIHDARIPNQWYAHHVCTTCTPLALLTVNQQLERYREFERGDRTKIHSGLLKGGEIVRTKVETKQRAIKVKWSIEAQEDLKSADPFDTTAGGILVPKKK